MKKVILASLMLITAASAFAQPDNHHQRPCRVWKTHHHHRYCAKH
jgi:hypothetical protein